MRRIPVGVTGVFEDSISKVKAGKVTCYNNIIGYGFLTPDEGEDIFVHFSALEGIERLETEDRVQFDERERPKGLMALNVTKT